MNTKAWYTSLTIWATAAVAFLQTVPDIITQINAVAPGLGLSSNPLVIKVLSIIGVIVAIYGRLTAKTVIASTPKQ